MLSACASVPSLEGRTASYALDDTAGTPIGLALAPRIAEQPGRAGFVPIADGRAAFGWRVLLARAATRSIDIQTYIWHGDATGSMLFDEMLRAADRGVRVRLLLDDANTRGLDPTLALLDTHPNIELRLYNPFVGRRSRAVGLLGDFERLNHRMHNKSFTVDNQVAVVGGRNLGNEYFEAGDGTTFVDLDVVTVGEVVRSVSAEFDLFWNSASAFPVHAIVDPKQALDREAFAQRVRAWRDSAEALAFVQAVAQTQDIQRLLDRNLSFEWATAQVVHDDPAKTLQPETARELHLLPKLATVFGAAKAELDLVSPYFVPGESGTATLAALARRGVRVRVLTNSLAATDMAAVHAGYAKRREDLLRAGVQLFEFRRGAAAVRQQDSEIGSSAQAGLHAKTFAVDRRTLFVGSFNLDPRSSKLNTEMGLLIDSPKLASDLSAAIDRATPGLAYQVTLDPDGRMQWQDGTGAPHTSEPESGMLRRLWVRILAWLPIEWLL